MEDTNKEVEVKEASVTQESTEETPKDLGITDEDLKLDVERDERTIPIAMLGLRLLADSPNLYLGSVAPKDEEKDAKIGTYADMAGKLIEQMLANNVRIKEVKWIFDNMDSALANLAEITQRSIEISRKKASAIAFGREDYDDVQLSDIDAVLRAGGK